MYNPTLLRAGFSGIVGLLQSNLPQVPQISAPLTTSSSGIMVQDKHPIVSLENIWYSAPDFNPNNWNSWVSGSNYTLVGTVVNYNNSLWQTLNVLTADVIPPPSDLSNWQVYNPFNTWNIQKYNQAVTNLFSEVVKIFKLQDSGKELIERQQLFRGGGSRTNAIVPDGSQVGFEIMIEQAEALMVQIDMLGTQFTVAQDLTFYLHHPSNLNAPVATFDVTLGVGGEFNWNNLVNCIMMYLSRNTQGTYLFTYYEADLVAGNQAVSRAWDCSTSPCTGCDVADLLMYNRWSRYTAFRNIKIPAQYVNLDRSYPNMQYATYGGYTNWGLNFSLTVRCDITDFILYSKYLYADALAMQWCLEYIKTIAHSPRIDPAMAQIKNQARAELNLTEKSTFINSYWDSVKALKIDMSGFSQSCQPCDKRDKLKTGKWRSV